MSRTDGQEDAPTIRYSGYDPFSLGSLYTTSGDPGYRARPFHVRPKFPRSDAEKVARMDRFVEWKRQKLLERRLRRAAEWIIIGVFSPVAAGAVMAIWKFGLELIVR